MPPPAIPPPSSLIVAVIGAGHAGRDFALACAKAGYNVMLEDVMPDKLRRAEQIFASFAGSLIVLVRTVEDAVENADIVVDFVPDELESKLEIWSLIDRMAPPKTILCTPSRVLSITDLASCTYRADRCIMVRGELNPGTTVELLKAKPTSERTIAMALGLFTALALSPTVTPDPDLPQLLKNMNAPTLI